MEKSEKFDGRANFSIDDKIENQLDAFFKKYDINTRIILRNFPLYIRRVILKRFLAHYELFRQTIHLPGDIVELGVYRGTTLLQWANFLESRNIGDRTKRVIGFDNFSGFKDLAPQDGPPEKKSEKEIGGFNCQDLEVQLNELISIFDQDRFIPQKERILLVKGDIESTIPKFINDHPGLRISLLHFDCDLYAPTSVGLKCLWNKVVQGGIIIFDEYGIEPWAGESQAVDEFLVRENIKTPLKTFDWHATPGAYLIKE